MGRINNHFIAVDNCPFFKNGLQAISAHWQQARNYADRWHGGCKLMSQMEGAAYCCHYRFHVLPH